MDVRTVVVVAENQGVNRVVFAKGICSAGTPSRRGTFRSTAVRLQAERVSEILREEVS